MHIVPHPAGAVGLVRLISRHLKIVAFIQIPVGGRCEKGQMRAGKAHRGKKRFAGVSVLRSQVGQVVEHQRAANGIGEFPLIDVLGFRRQRPAPSVTIRKLCGPDLPAAPVERQGPGALIFFFDAVFRGTVRIHNIAHRTMVMHFADGDGFVSVVFKVLGQGDQIRQCGPQRGKAEHIHLFRHQAGGDRCPRRCTDRPRTVGTGKHGAAGGQPIKIRCNRNGVAETAERGLQVVCPDHQHVRRRVALRGGGLCKPGRCDGRQRCVSKRIHDSGLDALSSFSGGTAYCSRSRCSSCFIFRMTGLYSGSLYRLCISCGSAWRS